MFLNNAVILVREGFSISRVAICVKSVLLIDTENIMKVFTLIFKFKALLLHVISFFYLLTLNFWTLVYLSFF